MTTFELLKPNSKDDAEKGFKAGKQPQKGRKTLWLALLVIAILSSLSGVCAFAIGKVSYDLNSNGQTYGHINPYVEPWNQEYPQLIAAIGIGGTEGYVYSTDLEGEQPCNPEEAAIYMEKLQQEIEEAKKTGQEYIRYIPLYDSDGVTVIGEFGVGNPFAGVSIVQ